MARPTPIERFASRIELDETTGCWNWVGSLHYKGYSKFWTKESNEGHSFSYRFFVGDIPEGMEIHHKCRNRRCVNPYHLETRTHQSNCLEDFRKDACRNGHPFVPGSYYEYKENGSDKRLCSICAKQRANAHYANNKESHKVKGAAYYQRTKEVRSAHAKLAYQRRKAKAAAAINSGNHVN